MEHPIKDMNAEQNEEFKMLDEVFAQNKHMFCQHGLSREEFANLLMFTGLVCKRAYADEQRINDRPAFVYPLDVYKLSVCEAEKIIDKATFSNALPRMIADEIAGTFPGTEEWFGAIEAANYFWTIGQDMKLFYQGKLQDREIHRRLHECFVSIDLGSRLTSRAWLPNDPRSHIAYFIYGTAKAGKSEEEISRAIHAADLLMTFGIGVRCDAF